MTSLAQQPMAWEPPPGAFERSPAGRLAARHGIADWAELERRARTDPAWFWGAVAADLGIPWMTPYRQVIDVSDGIELPRFFGGGRLNVADWALDRWVRAGAGAKIAIRWEGDDGSDCALTYTALLDEVTRAAGALRSLGVQRGDVVGMLLPMIPEAVVTLLAAARVGAVVAPMFSGFGAPSVTARLEDSGARVLVTCDAFPRRGRSVELKRTADEAVAAVSRPVRMLVVRRLGVAVTMRPGIDVGWEEALAAASVVGAAEPMRTDEPLLLLYTSGSTGRPKGCVHTHVGLPLKVAQEASHNFALDAEGTLLWVTDMGWVMGTYLVLATLINGATMGVYEGTPDWPQPDRLWNVVERLRVTVLGISPTLIRALMRHGEQWPAQHRLDTLIAIGSTGEPWNIDPWLWCRDHVGKGSVPIVNISGGTECGGALLAGATCLPAKPAGFAAAALGVPTDVVDAAGSSVRGAVGELVARGPWPGMTRGFWDGAERYLDTYWSTFPGMWRQGDFALVDDDGHWFILGRSDDTIMIAGKRLGPAEVESVLVADPVVVEAAAFGVPDAVKGETLVCLVTVAESADRSAIAELEARLADTVGAAFGKALRPQAIHVVAALPMTRNGKVLRRVARAVYAGLPTGDLSALADPGVLDTLPAHGVDAGTLG